MDWQAVGAVLTAIGAVATGAWAWILKNKRDQADTRADVAASDASRTVADSQQTVYKLLTERLTTLEEDVRAVRKELATERKHSRRLEVHIWRLEGLMRDAGLTPPTFSDGDAVVAEGH